jgi:exosome complex RNA-binding protein Rrp42 (RNase PH superfamily)
MAVVTASLEAPFADRHNEGSLRFNVEYSPMASPAFEPGEVYVVESTVQAAVGTHKRCC